MDGGLHSTDPTRHVARWLTLIGLASLAIAAGLALGEGRLLRAWEGFYDNWRDEPLRRRLLGLRPFFVFAGVTACAAAVVCRAAGRRPFRALWPWVVMLLIAVGIGTWLSHREWVMWERPDWDGYGVRANQWRLYFIRGDDISWKRVLRGARASHVGMSWIPPAAIGLIAAGGVRVMTAYMGVNLLSWLVVSACLWRVGRRHLGYAKRELLLSLVLLFGHQGVMRSLLFPQTDPMAIAMILLAVLWHFESSSSRCRPGVLPALGRQAVSSGIDVVGFFTKLSFLPAWGLGFLRVFAQGPPSRRWARGLLLSAGHVLLAAAACLLLLQLTGLGFAPGTGLSEVRVAPRHDYAADHNPLRFLVVSAEVLQFTPLILIRRRRALQRDEVFLLGFAALFPLALVALGTAFWIRYFLPMLPLLALVTARHCAGVMERAAGLVPVLVYVTLNAAFLRCDLYY